MTQFQFLKRQALYLHPDPARVVVRPFKPATEPRDLNPTDKLRANHIVGRVLRLEGGAAARHLTEVLESFEGRHRNLLQIFETRAAQMEEVLEPHVVLNKTQRCLIGAYVLHDYAAPARDARKRRCNHGNREKTAFDGASHVAGMLFH